MSRTAHGQAQEATVTLALPEDVLARGHVRATVNDGILDVVLDRPDARNAQTPATWAALTTIGAAVGAASAPPDVVVLRGAGPSFSSGLDRRMFTAEGVPGETSLADLAAMTDGDLEDAIATFQEAFLWQRRVPSVTVAAVTGHAIGAGFQLALACDVLLATPDAVFAMRETGYGLVPDLAGTHPLVRSIGYARALEACATGRAIPADEGYALGFVTRVVADLDDAVGSLAQAVAATPPGAVTALKALLDGAEDRTRADQARAERRAQVRRLRALLAGA